MINDYPYRLYLNDALVFVVELVLLSDEMALVLLTFG